MSGWEYVLVRVNGTAGNTENKENKYLVYGFFVDLNERKANVPHISRSSNGPTLAHLPIWDGPC